MKENKLHNATKYSEINSDINDIISVCPSHRRLRCVVAYIQPGKSVRLTVRVQF